MSGRATRVYLARPAPSDREPFLEMVRKSRRLHRPWTSPPADAAAFAAWVKRARNDDYEALLVKRKEDDAIAGVFNLSQIVYGPFKNAYLGYYAAAPLAAQGYMADGLQQVLAHAFQRLDLHRLEANVQPENVRSLRLIGRAGFRREGFSPRYLKIGGRWRDHERWAILKEDWRSHRRRPPAARPGSPRAGSPA